MNQTSNVEIRKTAIADLPRLMQIFETARQIMKRNGNPSQWGDSRPSEEIVMADILNGESYVIVNNNLIVGTFVFMLREEPSYSRIEGGWLNDEPYGTIHRLASDGSTKGIADIALKFCKTKTHNIRIDTHSDNSIMLNWITRSGFRKCGIIHLPDGSPRIAFQLMQGS